MNRTPYGFTLIELLVVIAIIGILSAIVLASLNSARERGREASIRSTLKSMSQQIELVRNDSVNYSFVNNCQSTSNSLHTFVDSMVAQGATVRCNSFSYNGDAYDRWGITAEITGTSVLTAWTASPEGVAEWDVDDTQADGTAGSGSMNWSAANSACALRNGRLPTDEELLSLRAISSTYPSNGFGSHIYWSSTRVPGTSSSAYNTDMNSAGGGLLNSIYANNYIHCIH